MTGGGATGGWPFPSSPGMTVGWIDCRPLRYGDDAALLAAVRASAAHLRPWMPWAGGAYTPAMARDFVGRSLHPAGALVEEDHYALCDRSGELLGMCGLHGRVGPARLEIGYWVDERHTRRGVASLGAAALTDIALRIKGVEAVEIHHDRANVASGAVATKLGYSRAGQVEREAQAPWDTGIDWLWRMRTEQWPTSAGAQQPGTAVQGRSIDPGGPPA